MSKNFSVCIQSRFCTVRNETSMQTFSMCLDIPIGKYGMDFVIKLMYILSTYPDLIPAMF